MIYILKTMLFLFFPLWLLIFYDIYTSKNSKKTKLILSAVNLVYVLGSLVYLIFLFIEKEPSFIKKKVMSTTNQCKASWSKQLLIVLLLDIMVMLLLLFISYQSYVFFNSEAEKLDQNAQLDLVKNFAKQGDYNDQVLSKMESISAAMKAYLVKMIVGVVLLFLSVVIIWTIGKGFTWLLLTKSKRSIKFFVKFFFLNGILWIIVLSLIFFILTAVQPEYVNFSLIFVCIIAAYGGYSIYYIFSIKQMFSSVWSGVKQSVAQIKNFVVPFTFLSMLFFIGFLIYQVTMNLFPSRLIVLISLMVLFLAFAKVFFVQVVKSKESYQ